MKITLAPGAGILAFLVFSYALNFAAFDSNFYIASYEKNGVYANFSPEEAANATDALFAYLQENNDAPIGTNFFNAKEKSHLADVKELFQKEKRYSFLLTILFVLTIGLLYFTSAPIYSYGLLFMSAGSVGLGILLLIGLMSIISFQTSWTAFHMIVFSNDLWLLNPATDNLIVMFPEAFFSAIITRIFLIAGVTYTALIAIGSKLMAR